MKRSIVSFFSVATLTVACSAPDAGTHTPRDVPEEPAAAAAPSTTEPTPAGEKPLVDRMRALDKTVYKVTVDDLPAIGSADAALTVVLFSDYECPFCQKVEPQIAQLRAEHGSDVRIVLAPKPLPFHKNAKPAALAAIAAAEQGKLEPMHRALVALDGKLDDAALTNAARDAGLDLGRFEADRRSAKSEKTLAKADEIAKRFSVTGTPTTFLNGRRITGAVPEVIHQLGEEQLAVGRASIKEGTPASRVYEALIAEALDHAAPDPAVTTIRMLGDEGADPKATMGYMVEVSKCWSAPGATPASEVELTINADGKVTRVATIPPEHAACVTKAASSWTFSKNPGEAKVKLVIKKP